MRDSYLLGSYIFNKYSKIQILIFNINGVLSIIAKYTVDRQNH